MTKSERIKKWKATIDVVVGSYKQLSVACDVAKFAGCLEIDGPMHKSIWNSFDAMMRLVDNNYWIDWHIYENECGKCGFKVSINGKLISIKTSLHLAKVIVSHEDQT